MKVSSSTSSSTSQVTLSSSNRLSGLMSGLDTDAIVKQLSAGTQNKIDKLVQAKQLSSWKQTSYREVTSALQEFQTKYLKSSTSSSNISNLDFFNTSTINNTSSYVKVSGNSTNAAKMKITEISQLAVQANFASSHKVSNETITSSQAVKSTYTASELAGATMTINYGGTDYAITLDSDFSLDDPTATDNLSKVTDALNAQISTIDGLKGKVSFTADDTNNSVKLSSTDNTTNLYVKSGTSNLLTGLGLVAATSGTTSSVQSGTSAGQSGIAPQEQNFFNSSVDSGASLTFTVDGTAYTLALSADVSLAAGLSDADSATALAAAFNTAISSNADLKGKLTASASDGKITFTGTNIALTGGDKNLLDGLGLAVNTTAGSSVSGTQADRDTLVKTNLQDALAGSTLSFSLDGVTKNITFNESDKSQYSTTAGLATYLQTKLNSAYGTGNVNVSVDTDSKLSFSTKNATSSLTLSSCDAAGVLGSSGALHIYAGETNRINTSKSLEDIAGDLNGALTTDADGNYGLTVNGKDFTFKATVTLATVISTINNDTDANVTISYSSTLDTFSVTADSGGESSKVQISTLGGSSLATSLFGKGADTAATLSYDFTGQTSSTLLGKTATIGGVTYEFTNGGTLSDGNTAIDLSGTTTADGIAAKFSGAVSLTGYTAKATTDGTGNVIFTSTSTGSITAPTTSGDITGFFMDGVDNTAASDLTYDFTGKTGSDMLGKTITVGGTTYEFTNGGSALNDSTHTAIDVTSAATETDIANAFAAKVSSVSGYDAPTTASGKVTFTPNSTSTDYTTTFGQNSEMMVSFDGTTSNATLISRSENKFTLDEVNIELLKSDPTDSTVNTSTPITFTADNATDDLYKKISDFVTDYNSIITLVSGKLTESTKTDGTTYAPLTDDQRAEMTETQITAWETNAKKGILQSDTLLSSLDYDLRDAMTDTVSSIKSALYSIGITENDDYDQYGKLTIDETTLKDALANNEDTVASIFTSSDGIAARLQTVITKNVNVSIGNDGLLVQKAGDASRTYDLSTLGSEMDTDTTKITDLKEQLSTEQDQYYAKFTRLESYLSTMNSQAALFTSSSSSS
jgi:flagellar hook-associated protein 2